MKLDILSGKKKKKGKRKQNSHFPIQLNFDLYHWNKKKSHVLLIFFFAEGQFIFEIISYHFILNYDMSDQKKSKKYNTTEK